MIITMYEAFKVNIFSIICFLLAVVMAAIGRTEGDWALYPWCWFGLGVLGGGCAIFSLGTGEFASATSVAIFVVLLLASFFGINVISKRRGVVWNWSKKQEKRLEIDFAEWADLEELKLEQKKWRNAKHFLKMSKTSKEFCDIAKKVGMTPDEFREYCKRVVKDYEIIHRQYNETHNKVAPWPSEYE